MSNINPSALSQIKRNSRFFSYIISLSSNDYLTLDLWLHKLTWRRYTALISEWSTPTNIRLHTQPNKSTQDTHRKEKEKAERDDLSCTQLIPN